ncbi:MAG: hypothetical protein ND895_16435 [Pyrinomonadaceae bacterium]|nr:hypothetical protein [Pyrinomonadaceae bacterium]
MTLPTMKLKIISCQTLVMTFAVLLGALWCATPTQAQSFQVELGLYREGSNDPKPRVFRVGALKDKKIYDTVEDTYKGIAYKIKVKGRCPDKHHLSESRISLSNLVSSKYVIFPVNENNRSIGGNHGQDWNYYQLDFPFLLPKKSPVETCNAEVQRRVDAGQSLGAILQHGFTVWVDDAFNVDLSIGCEKNVHMPYYELPHYYAKATLPIAIECRATGYVPPDPNAPQPRTETRTKPGGRPGKPLSSRDPVPDPPRVPSPPPPLTSVAVAAIPAETTGRACPLYVNFKGKILPNPDSKYTTFNTKYRFVGDHAYQTDWTFVAVSRTEPRIVNGRRFIQAPPNNPGTILAPGEKPKIPLYLGWMELQVQMPYGAKLSERVNFSVDCNVTPARPRIKASNE